MFTNFKQIELLYKWDIGVRNESPGLLLVTPLLLFSIPGFVLFYRSKRNEAILFLLIIVINVVIAALHKTVLTRHIFTITPFLFFPIIFVNRYFITSRNIILKTAYIIVFALLASWSVARVFYSIHTYYGRDLSNIFPFKNELSVFFIFILLIGIVCCLIILLRNLFLKS
ncbi:MAG: hypothetical protein IPJ32_06940 [Sphingobacteriaceae bacterium]|nr:hypothetical protein [Sphingobacteriaceae bacterium]